MVHNLNFNNGKASFFSVREKAWHGLGTIVQEAPTSSEAIKLAGLDYDVVKQPIYTADGIQVPNNFALVRQDNKQPFGNIVGNDYTVVQNRDCFNWFDSIVGDKLAIYETAGALGKGDRIFITAKMPAFINVCDDLIDQYLFLINSHGRDMLTAAFTPVRVVCENTVNAALADCSNRVKIMHRADVHDQMKEAVKVMGMVNTMQEKLTEVFTKMARKPIVDQELKDIILMSFANAKQLEIISREGREKTAGESASIKKLEQVIGDAYRYALESDTQQTRAAKGTLFGAYNAVTGYFQNVKEVKDGAVESHLNSIFEGSAMQVTQKAFDLCLAKI